MAKPVMLQFKWKGGGWPAFISPSWVMYVAQPADGQGTYIELKSGKTLTVSASLQAVMDELAPYLDVKEIHG